jgi:3-keto-disaccharide hydrolase
MLKRLALGIAILCIGLSMFAQDRKGGDPKLSEYWTPEPAKVTPGKTQADAPSDAIILFNGQDASQWEGADGGPVKWTVANGAMTVAPNGGTIKTKQKFGDCQLHIEWRTPAEVKGEGQGRGNSGIFLMERYELQVLDSYVSKTYVNGQAGSIYKQLPPLVNATRGPGEWQTYDVIFTAPRFYDNGVVKSQARITVFHNGVLVQNDKALWGGTQYIGIPVYEKHGDKESIALQDHGNPVSYRNIWIRGL